VNPVRKLMSVIYCFLLFRVIHFCTQLISNSIELFLFDVFYFVSPCGRILSYSYFVSRNLRNLFFLLFKSHSLLYSVNQSMES
jgi:hypothetical protein